MKVHLFSRNRVSRETPRITVAIPARNEADTIPYLLRALSEQVEALGMPRRDFQVVILVNGSNDQTEYIAEEALRRHQLNGAVLLWTDAARPTIGLLRRQLMDYALGSMSPTLPPDQPQGWIAWTDADCEPAADWITQTDAFIQQGAGAVAGHIEVDYQSESEANQLHRLRYQYHAALNRLWRELSTHPDDRASDHHFNCGASLAVSVEAYRAVGPTPALASGEDKALWQRIAEQGFRTVRSNQVRVKTSGRQVGRCRGGLAAQLQDLDFAQRRARWLYVPSLESVERLIHLSNLLEPTWRNAPDADRIHAADEWQRLVQETFFAWKGLTRGEWRQHLARPEGYRGVQARLRGECGEFLPRVALQEALTQEPCLTFTGIEPTHPTDRNPSDLWRCA